MDLKTDTCNTTALLSPDVVCEEQVSSFYANDQHDNKEQVGELSRVDSKAANRPTLEETVHIENRLILNDDYLSSSMADGLSLSNRTQARSSDQHNDYGLKFSNREGEKQQAGWYHAHPDHANSGHGRSSPLRAGRWPEHNPAVQRETVICSGERKPHAASSSNQEANQAREDSYLPSERYHRDRHQGFARELDQIFNASQESGDILVKASRYQQTLARGIDLPRSEANDEDYRAKKEFIGEHRREEVSLRDGKPAGENTGLKQFRSSPLHSAGSDRLLVEGPLHKQTIEDILRGQSKDRPSQNMHIQVEERRVTVNVSPPDNDYKCFGRSDLRRSPVAQPPFLSSSILRMPSTQMGCYPAFMQTQNQGEGGLRLKGKPEQMYASQAYPFGLDPRFYDGNQFSHASVGKAHQFQDSLTIDVSPSGQGRGASYHGSDSHGYQRSQQQLLQIPRPMALGPNFVPHSVHLQGVTPSSEEGNNSSPAGSSPFAEYGAVSPKSDDSARSGARGKHKQKVESSNQCSQCMKTFSSSSALAKHKLIHSDERKYVCQICSKGFKRQDHLNGHMITHRDKKPYQCHLPDCDKSYCDMRSLRRHLENHHAVCTIASSTGMSSNTNSIPTSSGSSTVTVRTVYPDHSDTTSSKERLKGSHEEIANQSNTSRVRTSEERISHYRRSSSCEDSNQGRSPSPEEKKEDSLSSTGLEKRDSPVEGRSSHRRVAEETRSSGNNSHSDDEKAPTSSGVYEKQDHSWRGEDSEGPYSRTGVGHPWSGSQPYIVQNPNHFLGPQGPWSATTHNPAASFKTMGQNSMPYLLGLGAPRFHSPVGFAGDQPVHGGVEGLSSKKQENGETRHPITHSGMHSNTLQMFNHSLAGQPNGMQSEIYMRPGPLPYFTGHHAIGRPTNPTAIAVAAAKDNSLYSMFQGRDGFYGAHPAVAQWQPVRQDDSITYEREAFRDFFSVRKKESPETVAVVPTISEELADQDDSRERIKQEPERLEVPEKPETPPPQPTSKMSTLRVNVQTSKPSSPSTPSVSPGRKQRPHPGPIIIPSAVNNKISHTVTFSKPSSARHTSPIRASNVHGFVNTPPFYTPPPMLSPRSIFFTGACTTPRSGQMPSTPSRLLLSTRRLSSTADLREDDSEQVFPEPKINVGLQFQAVVPDVIAPLGEAERDVHKATLMWLPLREEKYKGRELDGFFEMASSLSLYGGADNKEYAAHLLHKTRGNIKDAARLLLSRRHVLRADDPNADYHYAGATRWSAKERLAFRQAFRSKGKDFYQIQKEVLTKNVKQCVEFYYLWKSVHPEGFRARTRNVEQESEQEEDEVQTPGVFIPSLSTIKEAVFECNYPECRAKFVSRQALNGHIRVHGGSLTKPLDSRKQRIKPMDLFGTTDIPLVKKTKHSEQGSTSAIPPFKPEGPTLQFACKVCGRVFSKVKSRSAHMKTHVKKPDDKDKHKAVTLTAHA